VREKKKQQLREREYESASRSGAAPYRDRAIRPRYDQPRLMMADGTVLYQDQVEGLEAHYSEGLREMVDPWHTEATNRSMAKSQL
jgi:O-phosphoseryl-tRNA(Cys) synthetase